MAKVRVKFLDGHEEVESNCGTSVYNGFLYIWNPGPRKGRKPRRKIALNKIHSKKGSGQKGIFISKD